MSGTLPPVPGTPSPPTTTVTSVRPAGVAANALTSTKKSVWAKANLDLNDSTFSKVATKEREFKGDHKYDLQPEKFETYRKTLIEKEERMAMVLTNTIKVVETSNVNTVRNSYDFTPVVNVAKENTKIVINQESTYNVLKNYTTIEEDWIIASVNHRWDCKNGTRIFKDQDTYTSFNDNQLKASVMGSYIIDSLTDSAKRKLERYSKYYKQTDIDGTVHIDGPTLFYYLASFVKPATEVMVESVKMKIRKLKVSDFSFSVINLISEFTSLRNEIEELGGTYDENTQKIDLMQAIHTCKDAKFNRFLENLERDYRGKSGSIDALIREVQAQEIDQTSKNEWNVMSPEQTQILALATIVEDMTKNRPGSSKKTDKNKNNGANKDSKATSNTSTTSRTGKERKIPEWKLNGPKDSESKTIEKDNRTWHWCDKCNKGQGMWVLHDTKDHKDDFVPKKKEPKKDGDTKDPGSKPKDSKKVSFSSNKQEKDTDTQSKVSVQKAVLKQAKSYLAGLSAPNFQ